MMLLAGQKPEISKRRVRSRRHENKVDGSDTPTLAHPTAQAARRTFGSPFPVNLAREQKSSPSSLDFVCNPGSHVSQN
jgi:hypothetical protein